MRLLIEGWRGVNQSIAIVNQFQTLALLRRQDVTLFHRDLPTPPSLAWNGERNGPGFPPEDAARIVAIPSYSGQSVDAVYRIVGSPHSGATGEIHRTVTFIVTELGIGPSRFPPGTDVSFFTRDENLVITPTAWSAERLVEAGFEAERVRVIPHGVDRSLFFPLEPTARAAVRARLGFAPDETILLSIGGPFWNKGADLLLEAFALLRARGRRVRLVLKDQSSVYGVGMKDLVAQVGARRPELLAADTLGAISIIPGTLDFAQLRELFATADAYVSPYRAEGFNMPVLEAIACGVPVIVTSGGATADFCHEPLATLLPSVAGVLAAEPGFPPPRFMQPSIDDLVEAMDELCRLDSYRPVGWELAREVVLSDFSWDRAAALLVECAELKEAALAPAPINEHRQMSIVVPTLNSSSYIDIIAGYYKQAKLDPSIFVDSKTSDGTRDALINVGWPSDKTVTLVNPGSTIIEESVEYLSRNMGAPWVLRIDDDELPSSGMVHFLAAVIARHDIDVCGFPRYQCLVSKTGELFAHIGHDTSVHRQCRLYRPERVRYSTHGHTPGFETQGFIGVAAPLEACMIHLDWMVHSYEERKEKVDRYDAYQSEMGTFWRDYYLFEERGVRADELLRLDMPEFATVCRDLSRRFPERCLDSPAIGWPAGRNVARAALLELSIESRGPLL